MTKKNLPAPKMDVVFQSLFKKGNENITMALISDIIGRKIKKIDLDKNKSLLREYTKDKLGILDLIAVLDDGDICNIEVQLADNKDIEKRLLYYHSKIYSQQMLVGDKYVDLNKTISIALLDYNLEQLRHVEKAHTSWHIKEDEIDGLILTNELEMHIIELPKIRKMSKNGKKDAIIDWMLFLDNPNNKEVSEIMKTNREIEEAMQKLEEITSDEELMRIIDLRRKAILDENQRRYIAEKERKEAVEEAVKEGLERGMKQGIEQGIKKGIEQGIEQGTKNEKFRIAKNLISLKYEIDNIVKITGLSKEEIETIL